MNKSKYIKGAVALALTLSAGGVLTSCQDFLEEDPKGQLVVENFFQSENDIIMAINALYYAVQSSQPHTNPFIPDCQGSDIVPPQKPNGAPYIASDGFNVTYDYKGVKDLWSFQYQLIQACNLIIDNTDKADAPELTKRIAKGNAYFWRASAYFRLVRVFGPLPINAHNTPDNNSTPLSSVTDVYDLIESDLKNAELQDLPADYSGMLTDYPYSFVGSTNIWITKQAVKSLYCAVAMNMAGYPLNKSEYWAIAAEKGKDVYDGCENGTYPNKMETEYKDVYSYGKNFSSEMIVAISYWDRPGHMNGSSQVSQFPRCHRYEQLNEGWGDFLPELRFWAEFPEGPRKRATFDPQIYFYRTDEDGNKVIIDWWATSDGEKRQENGSNGLISVYHPMFSPFSINADENNNLIEAPYDYRLPQSTHQSAPQTTRYIRVSEVYLWFAEAAARAGMYQGDAAAALNKVMARAYDNVPAVTDIAEQAWKEHGYEVAGYPLALVSKRSDEFRMGRLKQAWQQRRDDEENPPVIVPAGTETTSYARVNTNTSGSGKPVWKTVMFKYNTKEDIKLSESIKVNPVWDDNVCIYHVYPPTETEKNPGINEAARAAFSDTFGPMPIQ